VTGALIGNPIPLINNANGFPYAVHIGVIKVVAEAIRHAWDVIHSDPSKHLVPKAPGAPDEDRYTDAICQILDQMLSNDPPSVEGFTSDMFQSVSRSESASNFSGQNLNKQPDILIRLAEGPLIDARRFVGIYVEAKIVSMSHSISKYTNKGLRRFVVGEYSWAMQEGMMISYQRIKHRPIAHLAEALKNDTNLASIANEEGCFLDQTSHKLAGTACSKHQRTWNYVGGGSPGEIRVWHLWDLEIP